MASDRPATKRPRRSPKPLDGPRLEELALAYVARFATSAAKLERYLGRKLRERGWEGEGEPDLTALVARYAALGYVDDAAFAQARSGSLLRRGYGPRRIGQALGAAGIDAEIREQARPDAAAERHAALAFARRRGFGPFGASPSTGRAAKSRSPRCCAPGTRSTARAKWSMRRALPRPSNGPRRAKDSEKPMKPYARCCSPLLLISARVLAASRRDRARARAHCAAAALGAPGLGAPGHPADGDPDRRQAPHLPRRGRADPGAAGAGLMFRTTMGPDEG